MPQNREGESREVEEGLQRICLIRREELGCSRRVRHEGPDAGGDHGRRALCLLQGGQGGGSNWTQVLFHEAGRGAGSLPERRTAIAFSIFKAGSTRTPHTDTRKPVERGR